MDATNIDLVIYDLARDTPTQFTFAPEADQFPVWTPDEKRIVFQSIRDGGASNLYWRAADGTGQVERLTTSDNYQVPFGVSPDGLTLLFVEVRPETGSSDIGALSLEGERAVTWLVEGAANEGYPDISPDGRWVVYSSTESGQYEVFVRPFPNVDDGRWQISQDGGVSPLWGPDSREVFFQTADGPGSPVTLMVAENDTEPTFAAGIPRQLFEGPYRTSAPPWPRRFGVSPDGQRFLMIKEAEAVSPSEQSSIIAVFNWAEELKTLFPDN